MNRPSFHRCKSDGRPISGPLFGRKLGVWCVWGLRRIFLYSDFCHCLLHLHPSPWNIQYLGSALHCLPSPHPPSSIWPKMAKNRIERGSFQGPASCTWQQWNKCASLEDMLVAKLCLPTNPLNSEDTRHTRVSKIFLSDPGLLGSHLWVRVSLTHQLVAKIATDASSATWWLNL